MLIEHNPSGKQYVVAEAETENELFSDENKRNILESFDFSPVSLLQTGDDVVILPLYLMDHSGLSIGVSDFCDRWDSGQVGWAFSVTVNDFPKKVFPDFYRNLPPRHFPVEQKRTIKRTTTVKKERQNHDSHKQIR